MVVFAHGFRGPWMANPCFCYRRFMKMKKPGTKVQRESQMNQILGMVALNLSSEAHLWSAFLHWTPKTSIWRAPSCRITYIMRHGLRVALPKCNAVCRIDTDNHKVSYFYTQNGGVLGVKLDFLIVQLCIDFITMLIQAGLFLWLKLAGSV